MAASNSSFNNASNTSLFTCLSTAGESTFTPFATSSHFFYAMCILAAVFLISLLLHLQYRRHCLSPRTLRLLLIALQCVVFSWQFYFLISANSIFQQKEKLLICHDEGVVSTRNISSSNHSSVSSFNFCQTMVQEIFWSQEDLPPHVQMNFIVFSIAFVLSCVVNIFAAIYFLPTSMSESSPTTNDDENRENNDNSALLLMTQRQYKIGTQVILRFILHYSGISSILFFRALRPLYLLHPDENFCVVIQSSVLLSANQQMQLKKMDMSLAMSLVLIALVFWIFVPVFLSSGVIASPQKKKKKPPVREPVLPLVLLWIGLLLYGWLFYTVLEAAAFYMDANSISTLEYCHLILGQVLFLSYFLVYILAEKLSWLFCCCCPVAPVSTTSIMTRGGGGETDNDTLNIEWQIFTEAAKHEIAWTSRSIASFGCAIGIFSLLCFCRCFSERNPFYHVLIGKQEGQEDDEEGDPPDVDVDSLSNTEEAQIDVPHHPRRQSNFSPPPVAQKVSLEIYFEELENCRARLKDEKLKYTLAIVFAVLQIMVGCGVAVLCFLFFTKAEEEEGESFNLTSIHPILSILGMFTGYYALLIALQVHEFLGILLAFDQQQHQYLFSASSCLGLWTEWVERIRRHWNTAYPPQYWFLGKSTGTLHIAERANECDPSIDELRHKYEEAKAKDAENYERVLQGEGDHHDGGHFLWEQMGGGGGGAMGFVGKSNSDRGGWGKIKSNNGGGDRRMFRPGHHQQPSFSEFMSMVIEQSRRQKNQTKELVDMNELQKNYEDFLERKIEEENLYILQHPSTDGAPEMIMEQMEKKGEKRSVVAPLNSLDDDEMDFEGRREKKKKVYVYM